MENACNDVRNGLAGKRLPTCERFVEDASKRPDVRAFVERLSSRLLRTHVRRCPEHDVRSRARARYRGRLRQVNLRVPATKCFGQPEIQNFNLAFRRDLRVRWLQVSMNDAPIVSRFE